MLSINIDRLTQLNMKSKLFKLFINSDPDCHYFANWFEIFSEANLNKQENILRRKIQH